MNKIKVVVTIGPNSSDKEKIRELIENGADVVRLNLSYTTKKFCTEVITNVREINEELDTNVGIMLDLNGPVIRCGKLADGKAFYKLNDRIRIYRDNILGDSTKLSVDYSKFIDQVSEEDIIKLQDGNVEFLVQEIHDDYIICLVTKEGTVFENKDIIVVNKAFNIPFLREIDRENILYADKMDIDFLALSYVRSEEDVLDVNDMLIELGNDHIEVISKIENIESIDDIDNIIKQSSGVMLDRTNLGVEFPVERVPAIQKIIINKCHRMGKVSIVTTDLETEEITPSRAEVSDIVNAVLDGTDAISLADEIAIGNHPVTTLKIIDDIIKEAEKDIDYDNLYDIAERTEDEDITGMIACNVTNTANRLKCKAIIIPTMSGYTARKISRFRPSCPIIAVSPNENVVTSLSLHFGVEPKLINELNSLDKIIKASEIITKNCLDVKEGDKIIITGGYPFKETKSTNFMKIEEIK